MYVYIYRYIDDIDMEMCVYICIFRPASLQISNTLFCHTEIKHFAESVFIKVPEVKKSILHFISSLTRHKLCILTLAITYALIFNDLFRCPS